MIEKKIESFSKAFRYIFDNTGQNLSFFYKKAGIDPSQVCLYYHNTIKNLQRETRHILNELIGNRIKKVVNYIMGILIVGFIVNCSPKVITNHSSNYQSVPKNIPILIYGLNETPPNSAQIIGSINVNTFTVFSCSWDKAIQSAINESRKIGGNAIKLLTVEEDEDLQCYRLSASSLIDIGRLHITDYKKLLKSSWNKSGIDTIEGIYEKITHDQSGKYTLAIKKKNNAEYDVIYLTGAKQKYANYWHEGDVKAKITKTGRPNLFKGEWYMADKLNVYSNLYFSFNTGTMNINWPEFEREETYLKLYPHSDYYDSSISSNIVSSGTGFALNEYGYIVTNDHVIKNTEDIFVRGINSDFENKYKAKIVLRDNKNDLAIIKIIDNRIQIFDAPPYSFNKTVSEVGESVFTLGYPLSTTMGDEIKVTSGIISSKSGFKGDVTTYQVSTPVQPGNSGGPLLDKKGNIIGVIVSKHSEAENASYAIKISYLINMLSSSIETIELNNSNSMQKENLQNQVKKIRDFVYIIES